MQVEKWGSQGEMTDLEKGTHLKWEGPEAPLAKHTEMLLEAIRDTKMTLEEQIAAGVNQMGFLYEDHKKLAKLDKETDTQISTVRPNVRDLTTRCFGKKRGKIMLVDLLQDNLSLVEAPEGTKGSNVELLMEDWLFRKVLLGQPLWCFSVERAIRIPVPPPVQRVGPRSISAQLLKRDVKLQASQKHGPWMLGSREAILYPDCTTLVQRQRGTCVPVKKVPRQLNLKYVLIYPAKLRIVYTSKAHFLLIAQEA
ncbi:hypothetical protein NDU88_003394 [Pleurodeles waltl]|uniref:Uncharacterized protein n=1 Tax=Pleurodeles waltl TaxID=8319 RepID=A0AAV7WS87_PLEWA|nr:hypothetical protein NDU88_003394 [Pleurodeles waltl]